MKLLAVFAIFVCTLMAASETSSLVFRCRLDNDLYRAVAPLKFARYDTTADAVQHARDGAGLLILADGYPDRTTEIDAATWTAIERKHLRVFVEYPAAIPGLELKPPRKTEFERTVVSSEAFAPALQRLRILAIHDCHFVPAQAAQADLVVARVAGFDTAVFGIPSKDVSPLLFEVPGRNLLVATTKLSQFVTGRYAPPEAWLPVWRRILAWAANGGKVPELHVTPTVRPSFAREAPLPADAEQQAFERGAAWFENARMFVDTSWKGRIDDARKYKDQVAAPPELALPTGDGSEGVLEGFNATIRYDGSQLARWWLRNDCIGETAGTMAISGTPRRLKVAANLLDFAYFKSALAHKDPAGAAYGLLGWNTTPKYFEDLNGYDVYYGDDNARALLGSMAAAALVKSDRWDESLIRAILANFRTTGKLGFREDRIDEKPLREKGWRAFYQAENTSFAPHYQSYLWACYLWAYTQTGYEPFLVRTKNAIRMTMEAYPDRWHWTNGIQQERARMLLPLAWLVRIEDTAEHRAWLHRIAGALLASQDASGAIREEIGAAGKGAFGPPQSNEAYGTSEAPLIQKNGDPLSDLLYTTNFAFLGLHEAAAATGDAEYRRAADKLAGFLVRVQVRSEARPELDGAWFRAFDFGRWEYWASNADAGWGAWSVETGWTQSWITSVFGMRRQKTSLWEITRESSVKKYFPELLKRMIPEPSRAGAD